MGKTTLLKLLIRHLLLEEGIDPRSIFYISLDYEGLEKVNLIDLLTSIAEIRDSEIYIFLDEASMYSGWARALKNFSDMGLLERRKVKIIATGSHSMDLAEAVSKLSGRQGLFERLFNVGGNLIHLPLRFPEIVESVREDIDMYLSRREFRRVSHRFNLLLSLARGEIPESLNKIHYEFFVLLNSIFEDYLIHGGYPRAVDEYKKRKSISKEFYADIAKLIISDSQKAGLDPVNLMTLLEDLTEPTALSNLKNFSNLNIIMYDEKAKPRRRYSLKAYIDYLKTTWTFFFSHREANGKCKPNLEAEVKNYVLDPFIYHSLYSYLRNIPDPFENSNNMLDNDEFKGRLVESVVASHLLLSQQLFERVSSVDYSKVLMYGRNDHLNKEIDFVLCVRKGRKQYRFEIEVKYRSSPGHVIPKKGKIVLTKDVLDVCNDMVYIPVPLFLLMF